MNKKRIILGLLIAVVAVICGAFITNTPQVFAVEQPEQQVESVVNEAGTFYGQGYYTLNSTATLKAEMNAGYQFDAWVAIDEVLNETELSTEREYTFVVDKNVTIKPTWHKIEYNVTFDEDLYIEETTELKDFTYQIVNKTEDGQPYYYENSIEIKVEIKNGNYIYDLESANITINGNNIGVALGETGSCVVNNNEKTGFRNFVITLNITEDIEIDINYIYMYALQIVSGDDSIDIGEIIQFVTISNHYSQPDNNEYIYLVRADKQVNVTVNNGNDVYQFVSSQFQGQDPNFLFSQAYTLEGNRTLTLNYHKKEYIIQFTSYITNLHGINDLLATEIYSIDDVDKVTAGDTVGFVYDSVSRDITITDVAGNPHIYSHANNIYGYEFKGFAIDNNILVDDTYTLSNAAPSNIEIQLIFEYIEYDFKILLVDDYFESDVTYDRSTKQVVVGTEINLEASTTTYAIMGWSWSPTPKTDGYVVQAEPDSTSHTYLLTFEPRSDDNTQPYIMYLDVDYKYLSATFALKNNSINQNVVYDILTVNTSEKTIIFSDSENIKSSDTISYLDSDVTIDGSKTIISTAKYGNIEIEGNVLSYTVNSIKQSSVAMTTEGADYIYTFKKYTYFGDLQLSVIQEITLSETASDVTFVLRGSTYSHQTTDPDSVTIEDLLTKTTTKTEESVGVYKINYTYPMYLYMNEAQYDYIILRNVRYDYDGTKFVLINATINTPKPIDLDLETGLNYGVKLNNLLPNALLMYSTKTTNVDLYQFTSLANQTGTVLLNFVDNAYNSCILNISSASQINATYRQLSDNINLVINNERAYSYEKISISVQHEGTTTSTTGDVVSAVNGDTITIAIQSSEITPGYKFNNYLFNDSTMLEDTNEDIYILTFVMDLSKYAKEVINLSFSPIEYTVNINYINSSSEIINKENAKGAFKIQGEANAYSSYIVKLPDETNPLCEYEFEAVAENGYYVSKAYTGTETYNITSLVQDNSSIQTKTTWTLNEFNFVDAIVAPAGEGTEVNLYICFTIHTYSVKVYFEIDSNASVIDYPTAIINDSTYTFIKASEIIGGIDATRYYVFAEGIEYNSDVNIQLDNFMLGTMMLKWTDMSGNTIKETTSTYSIANINQDIKLKAVLQYIPYRLQFVTIDESGKNCSYGTVTTVSQTVKMYNDVTYYVNTEVGYILYEKYYYNNIDEKVILSNESNTFAFDPANFKLEGTTVKIYFVFTLKVVNLSISNTIDGFMHYYEDKQESELATYTVTRARNGDIEQLTDETGYEFKTGDVLIMKITPISIGVQLSKVQLGATTITTLSNLPYKLSVVNIKDMEDNITGVYYDLQIEFTAGVISALSETTTLQNVIQVKEYNVTYTYNYIDYKFGIQLRRQVGGSTSTGVADTAMNIENLGFGTGVTFTYM